METKKTSLLLSKVDCSAIAKSGDSHHTLRVLKLVAVAAVLCQRKTTYIQRMMHRLSASSKFTLKHVLEETIESLHDADETTTQDETTEQSESQTLPEGTQSLESAVKAPVEIESVEDPPSLSDIVVETGVRKDTQDEKEVETRVRQLEAQKLEQDETICALTLENNTLRGALKEQSSKLDELTAQNHRLADEIDILQPQVQQLYHSQAEISILKQRVEDLSFEKSKQSSEVSKELSVSLPLSEEDMDVFPFFEDNETSTNLFLSLHENMDDDTDLVVIPDEVDENASVNQLKCQIELLIESQQLKDSENENLRREKVKLESYTKRAVTRYQDQYLAAKQDLAASQVKVKEQQELIAMLQNCIERQLSPPTSLSNRRRTNMAIATKMKRTIQDYGLGAY